jgi:hypothetical protein
VPQALSRQRFSAMVYTCGYGGLALRDDSIALLCSNLSFSVESAASESYRVVVGSARTK